VQLVCLSRGARTTRFQMIEKKTVLILAAGASKPYGFPTGEELLREIVDIAKSVF